MLHLRLVSLSLLLAALLIPSASAETVKDREGAVRKDRATLQDDARWIYNDWQRGFEEAKRTGKPLLVVLRCVPCLACSGIDSQVLLQESDLAPLLEQFVCVRVINANTLDLARFQFDYDLSFSTLFFNGDGTVYGRYGSWAHQKDAQEKATLGYQRALQEVLALHRGYPANKEALSGKQGRPLPFTDPLQLPALAGRFGRELDWGGKVVQSCVHCHQIGDALREHHRAQSGSLPNEWIYPWPEPSTIGLTLAPAEIAKIEAVAADSPAAKSGLRAGDRIFALANQPLISIADLSWALHGAADSDTLPAVIAREGKELQLSLALPPGWRTKSDISRRVGTWPMRAMASGGLRLEDLTDAERTQRGLGNGQMALLVKHAGEYGKHAAAKKAGFRKDDVLIEVDGISHRTSESELIGHLLTQHRPGEQVKAAVLRGSERLEYLLPIQ